MSDLQSSSFGFERDHEFAGALSARHLIAASLKRGQPVDLRAGRRRRLRQPRTTALHFSVRGVLVLIVIPELLPKEFAFEIAKP